MLTENKSVKVPKKTRIVYSLILFPKSINIPLNCAIKLFIIEVGSLFCAYINGIFNKHDNRIANFSPKASGVQAPACAAVPSTVNSVSFLSHPSLLPTKC
jgi:hypothetical protein